MSVKIYSMSSVEANELRVGSCRKEVGKYWEAEWLIVGLFMLFADNKNDI